MADLPELLCGPTIYDLSIDETEKPAIHLDAEEFYRLFYHMVEAIMSTK
jgi:hypothetical protein